MIRVDRACVVALLLCFAPISAHAQSAEAEVLFRDGRALIKKGKIGPGCDKLAASERLESSVGTLLNLGDCREKLGKHASAWAAFRKAEAFARRTGGDDKRMAEAGKRAQALEPKLATLVIDVPTRVDGLIVRRDGEVIDSAGWSTALPVDPQTYTIVAEAPGYLAWHTSVTVAPGAKRQVVAVPALERAPIATAPVAAVWPPPRPMVVAGPAPRGTWSTTRKVSIGVAIAGAGALGVGAYFGVHAKTLQDRADQRCPMTICPDPEGLRLNDDAQQSATRANILYIAGGATIAAAAVMWFVGAPGETVIAPSAGNGQYGVAMTGASDMRLILVCLLAAACSIPDKKPATGDDDPGGEVDAGVDATPDSDAPDTKLDEQPVMFSNIRQAAFRFSSTDPTATFVCRVDEEAPAPCQSPFTRSLADGAHSFSVRAIDAAGNMDETPAERVWTIDTAAPDTQLTTTPPVADNSVMAIFAFKSAERNVTFDCQLDNAGFAPCTSGASFGPVADGTHAFAVRAKDRAGNLDASPAIYAWTVNTSTPDTQILTGPATASPATTASFTFFSPDAGGGATFTCALDAAAFTACTSPMAFSALAEGPHAFQVRVRDAVGNVDPSPATKAWTVDLTPPQTTISDGPSGATGVASASFAFAASETDVTFMCSLDGGGFADCTSPASFTTLAQGAHSFAVRATDAAGRIDTTPATRAWTVDTVAPSVTVTSGPGATSGPRVAFGFDVSDGTVTCSLDGAAFTACTSPLADNLPAGMHTLVIRAVDAAANLTEVSRSWSVACAAPSPTGAAGLLHLDDIGQSLSNAVDGGAGATLGDSDVDEPVDPIALAPGRFVGALSFTGGAHVAWPIALTAQPDLTVELWARPNSVTGARELVASGDGRAFLRVSPVSPTTVRFTVAIVEAVGGATRTVQSAAVDAGAWHHVIVSLQQPALRLWVDGVRTEISTVALDTPVALDSLRLGGAGGTGYDGALDEVWVAQTAITTDDAALQRYCPL